MFQCGKVVKAILHFSIGSLFISSTVADWADPWIVGPPISSEAYGRLNVTSSQSAGDLYAEEGITRGVLLAILRYNDSTAPILSDGCKDIIELSSPVNQEVRIISLKEFDFESGDPNSDTCVFVILNGSFPLRPLNFMLVDVNDNRPYFVEYPNTTLTFYENQVGQVYDFDATDRDQGDISSLRFTMTTLAGDGSNFTLDGQTGILSVTEMLDFEAGQFYLFQISVTDRGGLSSSVQVALNVIDVKDSPPIWKAIVPFVNIPEELPVGSSVFSVLAQDGDITVDDQIVYSLVDARDSFGIDSDTGQVKIAKRIDRDIVNFDSYFDLQIMATCKNYPEYKTVTYSTVAIDDINDNLPVFDRTVYDFDAIDEGFVGRLSQMDILVSDPDLKDEGSYTMMIQGPPEVIQYVTLSPTSGRNDGIFSLRINSTDLLDYEDILKRNVTFEVVATEVSGSQLSQSCVVKLHARDINDNSPVFSNNYTASIVENLVIGNLVVKIEATDGDFSPVYGQPSIRYSFVESYDAGRFFNIDEVTGEIRTVANIDREFIGSSSLSYTVQAIDKNGTYDGLRAVTGLTIAIEDVNDDAPSFSSLSTANFDVEEDAASGSFLADFTASDRDENPDLVFSIDWDKSKFYKNRAVISNPPAELKKTFVLVLESRIWTRQFSRVITTSTAILRVGDSSLPPGNCDSCPHTPLDHETFDSVQLCLTVTDLNTEINNRNDELYVVVDIGDINDNNPIFDQDIGEFTIVEGNATAIGTVFGSIQALDIDANNVITYSISLCDNVAIDAKTGRLSTTALIDREEKDFIVCNVTATDNGSPTRSSTTTIGIIVIDVNDNEPRLTVTPTRVSINECSLKSSTKNGTFISMLEATDADAGAYGTVSFMFSQQNFEGVDEFAINLTTGEMTVRNCELLDFETKKSYSVVVEARDNYREGITLGSLSAFERVDITLLDLNDNSPTLQSPGSPNGCYDSPFESLLLGEQATSMDGYDDDSDGPNKWMTFTLHDQDRLDNSPLEKCDQPFRMETASNSTGKLIVAVSDMFDCTGVYDVIVQACDQGDSIEGVRCSSNTTYRICVVDVNNNYPQFIFPESDYSTIEVREDSTVGQPLLYNGTSLQLTFEATDADEGINGQIVYSWTNSSINQIFALNEDTGRVFLNSQLNRAVASFYDVIVVATDRGIDPLSNSSNLRINVRLSNKQLPHFPSNTESLTFTENEMEIKTFLTADDPDNANLYPGESRYDVCYYLICGNNEYFDVADKTLNQLTTKKKLDSEQPPDLLYVIILATNDCTNRPIESCSDIDATKGQYLNITINIEDVNDCFPVFSGSLSGGITEGDSLNTRVFPMTVTDEDENDVVTCKIEETYTVSESSVNLPTGIQPFSISSDQWIILLFTVQPDMKGYFTLNVTCQDKVMHSSRTEIKIYVVALEHKVDILFDNNKEEIEAKRSEIEKIFTETMGYDCSVEKVMGNEDTGTPVGNNSFNKALSHFIDANKPEPEPVLSSVILVKKDEGNISDELTRRCGDVGLTLVSVGPLPSEATDSEQLFRILFIIACVILIMMIALVFFYVKQTSELNRRVEALSVPKFGSQDSGINRTADVAPNSNIYRVEGSNPIYSIEQWSNSNHDDSFDNISQSSGDSIFIGVEDNPEFRDYINGRVNGKVNNGFVQEAPPSKTVPGRDPSMNDTISKEVSEPDYPPPPPPPRPAKRTAPPVPVLYEDDYGEDDASDGVDGDNINSNFSFGNVTMTEI